MRNAYTKEETTTKETVRKDPESRFAKVKRMLTDSLSRSQARTPTSYEEAKIMCKARKRKERQESVSSISQERKVIRSNSEERPVKSTIESNKNDIRRVWSHEDFQKAKQVQANNESNLRSSGEIKSSNRASPHRNNNNGFEMLGYDDCEHERRRSHERFARPLTQRGRRINIGRKNKSKHLSKRSEGRVKEEIGKENERNGSCKTTPTIQQVKQKNPELPQEKITEPLFDTTTFLQLQREEKDQTPSPVLTPVSSALDLTTLHQQIDCSEPIPSTLTQEITDETETLPSLSIATNRLISSPRNSIMITHRIYLDPNVPQTNLTLTKEPKTPLEKQLKQLSKQINSMKRKVKKYDDEFSSAFGYKPSHADKMSDKGMKKLCADLSKLKKEYKQLKDDSVIIDPGVIRGSFGSAGREELKIQDTLAEIEKKLDEKRSADERTELIDEMSSEQIMDEKVAVQKALLYLESIHGRPNSKDDRDLVRPLYDRYRNLKRMMAKVSLTNTSINELATIHEYETMDFVSPPTQSSDSGGDTVNPSATDSDTDLSLGESFHTLTLAELLKQQRDISEEKKMLRRSLKEFETEFQTRTGRKLQKDDRLPMASIYSSYKQAKAKLRLLDALVGKQVQ